MIVGFAGLLVKCGMLKVKCVMETVERWCGTVVKCGMRKFAYVGDRLSIVNSGEWACCTVVVRSNFIKFE